VTPTPVLLLGGSGLAREISAALRAINALEPTWDVVGVLDDDASLHGTTLGGHPVLGPLEAASDHPDAHLVLCIAAPVDRLARKRAIARIGAPPERYATVIHPAASLSAGTEVGVGSVVLAGTVATSDVVIGGHCVLMPQVTLTHDVVLNDHVVCGAGALLCGGVQVGEGCYLGAGCRIRERCWIGAWSTVGMGAAVLHDVPVGQIWVGVPARYLRSIELPMSVA
jgi:sugar O-acyltransferase (sialic acid O-acetyltransferase NeuD family)